MARPALDLPPPPVIAGMRADGLSWKQIARRLERLGHDRASRITLWRVLKHRDDCGCERAALTG